MYACARAENRERDLSKKSARACVQVVDPFLSILQKEKKVVFTAAIHRSISRPFLEISKRIFDSSACGSSNFSHERNTHNALKHIERAPLSFFLRERASERERESLFFICFFFEGKARERKRSSFVRFVFPLNFSSFSFPKKTKKKKKKKTFELEREDEGRIF